MHLSKDFFLTAAHMLDVSSLGGGWPKETYVGPSSWKHVKRKFNVQLLDFFHNFFSTWYINWYWTICNPVWKLHLYKKKLIKIQILKNPPRCSQSFRSSPPSMSTVLPAWRKESLFIFPDSPGDNVTVHKLWIAFHCDEDPLAGKDRNRASFVSGRHWAGFDQKSEILQINIEQLYSL